MAPLRIALFVLACWPVAGLSQAPLTLQEAESLAVGNDPQVRRLQAEALALDERAVAAGALPDPRLKAGLVNLPWRQMALGREPMTQTVLGVTQRIPARGVRGHRAAALRYQAQAARARAEDRALRVLRDLRQAWLELYYLVEAAKLIEESERVFDQWVKVTQYRYRAGRGTQHAVVRARLEQALLRDRREAVIQRQETWLARIDHMLKTEGEARTPQLEMPDLPVPLDRAAIAERLPEHPRLRARRLALAAARQRVGVAKAGKRPDWGVTVSYGLRAGERADFLSATVDLSLPLFPGRRQDRLVAARGHEVNAAKDAVDDTLHALRAELDEAYARWARLDRRLDFYARTVLPEASRNSETTRRAYQSRVSPFDELARARLAELEARLTTLRLRVDRAKAYYALRYLSAEDLQ